MSLPPRLNAFANAPVDRAALRRKDGAYLQAALDKSDTRLALLQSGGVLCDDAGPVWLSGAAASLADPNLPVVFLGEDLKDGGAVFAAALPGRADIDALPIAGLGAIVDMRSAAARLSGGDLALVGCAKALFDWHGAHGFCAQCGGASASAEAGWKRICTVCEKEHFPRVDPVVIMLPVCGDRCLLGRQVRFPPGMYSALAGFIEPGETIEEACARETLEEVGLTVTHVTIHSSQPWPFPSSLMIGLQCEVAPGDVRLDDEISDTVWLSKAQARAALAGGADTDKGRVWAPPPFAIAHQLLKSWADEKATPT